MSKRKLHMSLKSWVINRKRRGLLSRVDLPPRDTQFEPGWTGETHAGEPLTGEQAPHARLIEPALPPAAHLGAYAPLIAAIRAELELFIVSQLQLHLAIADRDRFVMTAIAVHCRGAEAARERLRKFRREFKPEQIKRYLMREVIAGLPNAASLDLSQFSGLVDAEAEGQDDDYSDLLAALEGPVADAEALVYEIELVGRWTESDGAPLARAQLSPIASRADEAQPGLRPSARPAARQASLAATDSQAAPRTPLAGGLRAEFEIDDAQGKRQIVLGGVLAGRRYLVGQQPGCDIVVQGTYTSRRHAQLWFEDGGWWVADAGSTNGIRVDGESDSVHAVHSAEANAPLRLGPGAQLVLSARSDGPATDHPRLRLMGAPAAVVTPIAMPIAAPIAMPAAKLPAMSVAKPVATREVKPISAALAAPVAAAQKPEAFAPIVLSPIFPHRPAPEAPPTPLTAVRNSAPRFVVQTLTGSTLRPEAARLPLAIGRSRSQALVIDRKHLGVSGHHLDIVALDAEGLTLKVHGDNGVLVDGQHHLAGSSLRWSPGQSLVLGNAADEADACMLQLQHESLADAATDERSPFTGGRA